VATAVHALTLLIEQRLALDVAAYKDRVELIVLPPLCPLSVSSTDFRSGAQLIARARTATEQWLDAGSEQLDHPERFLALHRHAIAAGDLSGQSLDRDPATKAVRADRSDLGRPRTNHPAGMPS
jgi:NTE family protein